MHSPNTCTPLWLVPNKISAGMAKTLQGRNQRQNTLRIIGGQWRRQFLTFPDSESLRPTPDRVRETLFNWLGQDLHGQRCLDLFSGSGALGFEAASRGAAQVVMVEKSPVVFHALLGNQKKLKAFETVEILRSDALEFAARQSAKPFDVVFLDPPFHQGWIEKLTPCLDGLLAPQGALYIEAETPIQQLGHWQTARQAKAGQVYYQLLIRQLPQEN